MSSIEVTAFRWVPPFAQGVVRDLRARWALEEAGIPYETRLIDHEDLASSEYRTQQPFGQVPVYREDGLTLFESGAIVLHIAEKTERLLPHDPEARARVIAWLFAALNSIEPPIQNLAGIDLFYAGQEWTKDHRPQVVEQVKTRLTDLSKALERKDYLEDRFTVADLMMTTVLRILRHTDLLAQFPVIEAFRIRCEARPAFDKALADQMAPFAKNAPPDQPSP